ncbi:hypothetical protein AA21952_0080 [Acetobacter oeni LMG 21952]|nr:hypothetical protein AA21952_0080 [Acetobacter oeni LMG 21952]
MMPVMTNSYTAILSIHGIGRHRRYANAGALLSALEAVSGSTNSDNVDTIIEVLAGIELSRDPGLRDDVPMLKLKRARRRHGRLNVGASFRIYEVNWSPDTRSGIPGWAMLGWTARLVQSILRTDPSNWLLWPRLRLARLRAAADRSATPALRHAMVVLASAYRKYRGSLGARHRELNASKPLFADYVDFAKKHAKTAATESNIDEAAVAWRDERLPCEKSVRNVGRLTLTGLVLMVLGIAVLISMLVGDAHLGPVWRLGLPAVLAAVSGGAIALGRRFLTTIFSDVRYWSALDENEKYYETRSAILDRATATLRHLVSDDACGRVVIVSHSLGTAIAYDALRAIGLYNLTRKRSPELWIKIRKVECLITMGSPVDKLTLLFETTGSKTFREEMMREELRGDETAMPFWVGDRQRIKWLNFWDPADPVSDALTIPLGAKPLGSSFVPTDIENVEVANTASHDPAGAHTGYLTNPAVATRIFNEIFRPEVFAIGAQRDYSRSRRLSKFQAQAGITGLVFLATVFVVAHFIPWSWAMTIGVWMGALALGTSVACLMILAVWPLDR